jgi:hypothetical protein
LPIDPWNWSIVASLFQTDMQQFGLKEKLSQAHDAMLQQYIELNEFTTHDGFLSEVYRTIKM